MCTIRLGDKTDQYDEGDIVYITSAKSSMGKVRLFMAYLDKVIVKPIAQLTSHELRDENPKLINLEAFVQFFTDIYKQEISLTDLVTVVYFSKIIE